MVIAGLAFVVMGVVFTVFVLMFVLMPIIALKVNLVTTIEYENNYNDAQTGLLVFLSSTENLNGEDKPISEILANHIVFNNPSDINFLNDKLNRMFNCYKLSDETQVLLEKKNCALSDAEGKAAITLPYGEYARILTLVVD